jgi:hypothetical protein
LPYVEKLAGAEIDALAGSESFQQRALYHAMAVHQGKIVDQVLQQEMDSQ